MKHIINYQEIFLKYFYLDEDGILRRAVDGYQKRYLKGDEVVGFLGAGNYLRIQIPTIRTTIPIHHVVALLAGLPVKSGKEVDHIDGNRHNNHPSNLRVVIRQINTKNRAKRSDNTSGYTGIRWSEYHQHFVIRRTVNGIRYSRSRKTLEEAIQVLEELTAHDTDYTERHGK